MVTYEQAQGYNLAVAEYTKNELLATQAARDKEHQLNNQVEEARNDAMQRQQQIDVLTNRLDVSAGLLRSAISGARQRLPSDSVTTIALTADTGLELFGECTDRYRDVAEKADGLVNEVKMLQEAWPK